MTTLTEAIRAFDHCDHPRCLPITSTEDAQTREMLGLHFASRTWMPTKICWDCGCVWFENDRGEVALTRQRLLVDIVRASKAEPRAETAPFDDDPLGDPNVFAGNLLATALRSALRRFYRACDAIEAYAGEKRRHGGVGPARFIHIVFAPPDGKLYALDVVGNVWKLGGDGVWSEVGTRVFRDRTPEDAP